MNKSITIDHKPTSYVEPNEYQKVMLALYKANMDAVWSLIERYGESASTKRCRREAKRISDMFRDDGLFIFAHIDNGECKYRLRKIAG